MARKRPTPKNDHRRQAFVREYLVDMNAAAAYLRAGYRARSAKVASASAARLLACASIRAAIDAALAERAERTQIKADRALRELARVAFSDMREFASWGPDGVVLKDSAAVLGDAAPCVAEVSQKAGAHGPSLRIKLHAKVPALVQLGKHLGLFPDKVQHGGDPENPVNVVIYLPEKEPLPDDGDTPPEGAAGSVAPEGPGAG
jgi:phage terminase small subunit